jgi:hypothetical protein
MGKMAVKTKMAAVMSSWLPTVGIKRYAFINVKEVTGAQVFTFKGK